MGQKWKKDEPVDAVSVDEDEDVNDDNREAELSDVFELRNCWHCDDFLPLDRPAYVIEICEQDVEETVPVCDGCFALHG